MNVPDLSLLNYLHLHFFLKTAAVFSSVMLRPPPGAERLSEVEALKRKTFLMQFLQEPAEEEGMLPPGGPGGQSSSQSHGQSGIATASSAVASGETGQYPGAYPGV